MQFAVHGLGEVGLSFATALADAGLLVVAIDVSEPRRRRAADHLARYDNVSVVSSARPSDVHVLAVGTPLQADRETVDLSQLRSAVAAVADVLRCGDVVIVRSTVPPGSTRDVVGAALTERTGLTDRQFHLAYAPDRSLSGDPQEVRSLPQLVGLAREESQTRVGEALSVVGSSLLFMEALEAAEIAKLANNAARDIGAAVANAVAISASTFNLDSRRIVREANRDYPRNPIVQPCPGVGGSCLPKDSHLLAGAIDNQVLRRFLRSARSLNDEMTYLLLDRLCTSLDQFPAGGLPARALILGAAFKGDPATSDVRNSTGLRLASALEAKGVEVWVHDPEVDEAVIAAMGHRVAGTQWAESRWDIAALVTNHRAYADPALHGRLVQALRGSKLLLDPWQVVSATTLRGTGVEYLGMSHRVRFSGR